MWLMYRDPLQRSSRVSEEGPRDIRICREHPKRKSFGGGDIDLLPLHVLVSKEERGGGGPGEMKRWTLAISLE